MVLNKISTETTGMLSTSRDGKLIGKLVNTQFSIELQKNIL